MYCRQYIFAFPTVCHAIISTDILYTCLVEEEISNMRSELEKYGIQMPAFSKIGGILANELSVDEAACKSSDLLIRSPYWNRLMISLKRNCE